MILPCENFSWADEDVTAIASARAAGTNVWRSDHVADLRRRIRDHHLGIQNRQCCYCRRSFVGEFSYVIDIEHVLPKSKCDELMFDIVNLSVACKRCNMEIKKDRIDFVDDLQLVRIDHKNSVHYKLVHPNGDRYFDHIRRIECASDMERLVKYYIISEKGQYTYDFFRLVELEINSFDVAQGATVDSASPEADSIRARLAEIAREII
jgi:hypothetical protein